MFSLLGLTVVLGLMLMLVLLAAVVLGPGDSGSLGPVPSPPPLEAGVGGSESLGSARGGPGVAQRVVAPGSVAVAGGSIAATGRPTESGRPSGAPAVSQARTVAIAAPTPVGSPAPETGGGAGDEVPSDETTAGEVSPEGTSSPATTPLPGSEGGSPGRPVAAGGPSIESCEGDEYVIVIALDPEASDEDDQGVKIVLTKLNEDGSVEELQLEGSLLDAQSLALKLTSEGNCVSLEAGAAPVPDPEEPAPTDSP